MVPTACVNEPLPPQTIWIVDDSPTQLAFTLHALSSAFTIETFPDGPTVIERLAAAPVLPDLVILDWVMPGMTGDEVCRYLRQDPHTKNLPIVMLTASRTETEHIVQALESGANDYIAKPFVAEELRARLFAILSRSRLEKQERATNRFLEEMVGIVAHDLRTPLNALHLGLGMLAKETSGTMANVVTRLDRSTRRMTKIVDQLLDITRSRLGSGIPLERKETGLRTVVMGVIEELRSVHPTHALVVSGPEVRGSWDADRLEQVIANLVNNATLYGRPGGRIQVAISADDAIGVIAIHNELRDAPISAAAQATLFDPFERGQDASNARGLGLGLYIVREVTRAHGGTVTVVSNESGTTFRVALPRENAL